MPELETVSCHNDFLAPLLEAEAELSHDAFDDRQHDDDWWEERRELYVELYRISAELEARCAHLLPAPLTRPCIDLPPSRAHEQEEVEWDASCLVGEPRHLRWSFRHWKVVASEARDAGTWPPTELMAMLKEADSWISYDYLLESSGYEFQVGDDVEIRTGAGWKRGIIVRRNYINAFGWHDYQVLVVEEDCCNSELDKMCRLLCVKDANDTCLRGHSKNSGLPMTKELCEILIDEVLKVLIQAWWIMDDGYKVFDVECGLLDEMELLEGIKMGLQTMSAGWKIMNFSGIDKIIDRLYSDNPMGFQSEECPLCCVPLPVAFGSQDAVFLECCGKRICSACRHESRRAVRQENLNRKSTRTNKSAQKDKVLLCAFCRSPTTAGDNDMLKARIEKRMELGDTYAMNVMGSRHISGRYGVAKDLQKAVDLFQQSVKLGSTVGCATLGSFYIDGSYGLSKDGKKARELLELAANSGSPHCFASSFECIGVLEMNNDNTELAMGYWRVIAAGGHDGAMKRLWKCYHSGQMSKASLEDVLRMHQASILEGSSECRDRYSSWKAVKSGDDEGLKELYELYYFGHINAKELEKAQSEADV